MHRRRTLEASSGSISGDARIDLERPGVDPARDVVHVLKTLREEIGRRLLAALPVVAVEVERRRLVEAEHILLAFPIEEPGPFYLGLLALLLRAHVEQLQPAINVH